MFRLIVALTLGSAAAFAPVTPSTKAPSPVVAHAKPFADELGAQKPLGCWDPLGILDYADQERFDRLRYVEIKHGRIAMLAVLGQIVTKAGIRLPGDIDFHGTHFSDIGTGWSALGQFSPMGTYQIVGFIGFLELFVMKEDAFGGPGPAFVGDFRNGVGSFDASWDKLSDEAKMKKRAIELNNGRAAQMGILALMVHEQLGVSLWPGGI
eukprot:CAMPEP_0205924906 /NCGR_PEP_ID=MMETSP1325-20131115/17244_1 /ASSEMBLY_ACC=CAM_ASM_000708 /TAXON_ID=236786 /ORGANISM="Florenciella sp., Strain RCC1007" /LENGTH=208 /DNA_ID=CAMNT_0053293339 /DNA_START=44 /DNA_END=670 /DNA_ORIENTATION=-